MGKTTNYRCGECGWTSPRWVGRCGRCQAWGSVNEGPLATRIASQAPLQRAAPIATVDATAARSIPTGIAELDRVLGSGLTPGGVVLLAGEPGVGKSTLLLEVASKWAAGGQKTLYISAEESAAQVRRRAQRIGAVTDGLYLAAETDLGAVLGHIEEQSPSLLVLDSVQTVSVPGTDGVPGGVSQVKEVAQAVARVAKQRDLAVLLVGHVTKDGVVAGPRTLEHLVDVVLTFEGDKNSELRMVRASKNRFGPADEIGCFELTEAGIVEVKDPSGLFVAHHEEPACGSCLTVCLEGRRPLLTEIQALVAASAANNPKRVANGVDSGRLAMLLAVLSRRAKLKLGNKEVYVSTIGGARTCDPAVDLALALAVAAAAADKSFPRPVIAFGEVGLSGEIRRAPGVERRLGEAARLGASLALVPIGSQARIPGLEVIEVGTLTQALALLGLRSKPKLELLETA
ncbi:MAG: DNA repair protein RadA [Propionibacteriaceae bacterium]|nr:DNA repair protein RadA [Propionibacteriaceae bacterium]